jgi:hypothetical protein
MVYPEMIEAQGCPSSEGKVKESVPLREIPEDKAPK